MDIKVLTASPPGSLTPASTPHFVEMRTHGAPLIYRLFMEMNSPHTPFHADHQGGGAIGQGRYVRAWRHVWGLADAVGATTRAGGNVIFVYCPQAYSRVIQISGKKPTPAMTSSTSSASISTATPSQTAPTTRLKAEGSTNTPPPTTNHS